ncbi:hypothetical protein OS493_013481 [Desmophyllum pertusum]|uniref:BHLH domain-containing protein n=1 Tax=Desmophyllum pertusum TaxID=174260 RepID=A0A9X0DB00_9CNID|nr:hypothetical protein OS493_013481 [Desmophyllum pertusum]
MFSSETSGEKELQDSRSREIRKCVRNYKKQMKSLEYSRLRSLVPSTASRPRVSKIEVIEEAIKYIAYLQATLSSRLDEPNENTNSGEGTVERTDGERRPKVLRQKRQRLASYMIKTQRHTLPARRKFSRRKNTETEQPR